MSHITTEGTGHSFRVLHAKECRGCVEGWCDHENGTWCHPERFVLVDDRCGCDGCTDAAMDHAAGCGCGTCWACDVLRGNQHGPMTLQQWLTAKALDLDLEEALRESVAYFADEAVAL